MMKIFGTLLIILLPALATAEVVFPNLCQGVMVKDTAFILEALKPQLFLLHNQSANDLWVTHPVTNPSASAGWSSRLESGKWSALWLDKKKFELNCIESMPGHEQQIPCQEVIVACRWSEVTLNASAKGTGWAGENMSLGALMTYLSSRGYQLPEISK